MFEDYPLFYINLENRKDRLSYLEGMFTQLGIKNTARIEAKTPNDIKHITNFYGCSPVEIACTYSHLYAIKKFLDTSDKDFAIICEDDVDLSNLNKIDFTVSKMSKKLNSQYGIFQLSMATREDLEINFKFHETSSWNFGTMVYVITRDYAEYLVKKYLKDDSLDLSAFIPQTIKDYRNNTFFKTSPTAEAILFETGKAVSMPLFSYMVTESSIQLSNESYRQAEKSSKDILNYWKGEEAIGIDSLVGPEIKNKLVNRTMPFLVFTSAGDSSDGFLSWLAVPKKYRSYNTAVVYYGNDDDRWEIIKKHADYSWRHTGFVWLNFITHYQELSEYMYTLITDDDLSVSYNNMNAIFSFSRKNNATALQLSKDPSSRGSYTMFHQNPDVDYRECNFIEQCFTLIRKDLLRLTIDKWMLFELSYGFGSDIVLSNTALENKMLPFITLDKYSYYNPHETEKPRGREIEAGYGGRKGFEGRVIQIEDAIRNNPDFFKIGPDPWLNAHAGISFPVPIKIWEIGEKDQMT